MKTVIAAVIVRDNKVLIGRRKKGSSMALKWEFPGGKLEPGETPEACLERELREELGIEARVGGFYSSGTFMPGTAEGIELFAYEASYREDDPVTLTDHEEIRWVDISDLTKYDFPEADAPIVLKLMKEAEMAIHIQAEPEAASPEDGMALNGWPVNRTARKMLVEAGETPDHGSMYLLQLVLWAINTGKTEAEEDVTETVNAMTGWRPQRIMNFLLLREDHEEYDPPGWNGAKTATDLALVLLDDLERKMVKHFPWYRSLNW